jgi:hypothetical protein
MTAILIKQEPIVHETDGEHSGGANFTSSSKCSWKLDVAIANAMTAILTK